MGCLENLLEVRRLDVERASLDAELAPDALLPLPAARLPLLAALLPLPAALLPLVPARASSSESLPDSSVRCALASRGAPRGARPRVGRAAASCGVSMPVACGGQSSGMWWRGCKALASATPIPVHLRIA